MAERFEHENGFAKMAFYGNLFLVTGAQGFAPGELTADQTVLLDQIALELLQSADREGRSAADRRRAKIELANLNPDELQSARCGSGRQKPRRAVGAFLLVRSSRQWVRREFCLVRVESSHARDFTEPKLRCEIRTRVLNLVGPETKVIIGHSMGSVVAYEVRSSARSSLAAFTHPWCAARSPDDHSLIDWICPRPVPLPSNIG